jgi:hypothetical protein
MLLCLATLPGVAKGQSTSGDSHDPVLFRALAADGEGSSTEGALFLLLPTGAQGVGMARAMTAMPSRESAFWNPAGLAGWEQGSFVVHRGDHLAGEATAVSLLLTRKPLGSLAVSYQLLDVGSQDLRDIEGNVLGTISVRNHLAIASFATQLLDRLDTGLNFKVVQFRIDCRGECLDAEVTGTTYAVDAGLQAVPFNGIPLRLGALVAHAGPRLQVINVEQADPLPTRLRVAAAYELLHHFVEDPRVSLWVTMEMEDRWRDLGSPVIYAGTELTAGEGDLLFVRAGYAEGSAGQSGGAAVGVGLRYERFELALGKSLAGSTLTGDGEPVHVTFGIVF